MKGLVQTRVPPMRTRTKWIKFVLQSLVGLFAIDSFVRHLGSSRADVACPTRLKPPARRNSSGLNRHGVGGSEYHQHLHYQFHSLENSRNFTITNWSSADGKIQHYTLERPFLSAADIPQESVLFLTVTRDENSWGRNPTEEPRTIFSHLDFITNTTLNPSATSVALLTSSQYDFERYKTIFTPSQHTTSDSIYYDYPFHRITLVLHTVPTRATLNSAPIYDPNTPRHVRHNIPQHERRAVLAKLRNYLSSVSLATESHLLWLDADVFKWSSPTMVETMLKTTTTTREREIGVLTARCRLGEPELADAWLAEHPDFEIPPADRNADGDAEKRGAPGGAYEIIAHKTMVFGHYDLNAWRGRRMGPNAIEQEQLWKNLESWESGWRAPPNGMQQILDGAIQGTRDDEVVRLDSVGGTVLMLRADLVRMGLNFATGYVVGMTYEHGEGYDGVETEGVCVLSRTMSRDGQSLCYTMGGDWSVWHTVY